MNFYAPSWDTCKAMECFFSYGGEFFSHRTHRFNRPFLRTVSISQNASGIQNSQNLSTHVSNNVL